MIQSVPNCRLRSTISATKTIKDAVTGEEMIPIDQSAHLGSFPVIPGMRFHVNPAKLSYKVTDPLSKDKDLCEKIRKKINQHGSIQITDELRGVPDKNGTVEDVHRMKTLCRELVWLLESGHAKIKKGPEPTMKDIDKLPGRYLLNARPGTITSQPMFEDELGEWRNMLARQGV